MKKGFTLIELLIVVGIIAVLATTVLVVLNPGQLLAESRDARRLADLESVKKAIAVTFFDPSSATGVSLTYGTTAQCSTAPPVTVKSPFTNGGNCTSIVAANVRNNDNGVSSDGPGWVGIDFTNGGTINRPAIIALPIDPLNNNNYFYAYRGNNNAKTYELNTRFESIKYRQKMINDGGDQNNCLTFLENNNEPSAGSKGCYYETGTDLNI